MFHRLNDKGDNSLTEIPGCPEKRICHTQWWHHKFLLQESYNNIGCDDDEEEEVDSDDQGFQSGPVPGTFTRLRSCIVPAEITEPPKISGGQNHKYDGR